MTTLAVLLLGWTAGLIGWWLTDSRDTGATPSAAVRLNPDERAHYSRG